MKKVFCYLSLFLFPFYKLIGQSVIINSDGTHSVVYNNGATSTIVNPDGTHSVMFNNGNISTIVNSDGSHAVMFNNGNSSTIVNADGSHSMVFRNGEVSTIVNSNGSHSTAYLVGNSTAIINSSELYSQLYYSPSYSILQKANPGFFILSGDETKNDSFSLPLRDEFCLFQYDKKKKGRRKKVKPQARMFKKVI